MFEDQIVYLYARCNGDSTGSIIMMCIVLSVSEIAGMFTNACTCICIMKLQYTVKVNT